MVDSKENANDPANPPQSGLDFTGLILGLSGAALSYLGHLAKHEYGNIPVNLDLVKQNIEILTMLQEKTRGNLNSEEDRILRQVITDLQFRYVEAVKATASKQP